MQNTKMSTGEYVLFSIPVDMLEEAGIREESVVQMSAGNGKIIINTVSDTEDFICDSDCEHCPMRVKWTVTAIVKPVPAMKVAMKERRSEWCKCFVFSEKEEELRFLMKSDSV